MKILVRIGQIDMFGFCGRDSHPEETDSKQIAELMEVKMQRFADDPYDDMDFITVKMADGRTVELVSHEVDCIHFGSPNVAQYFPVPLICDGCESMEDYSTETRDEWWINGKPELCDDCRNAAVQDAQEEADRKMGDKSP